METSKTAWDIVYRWVVILLLSTGAVILTAGLNRDVVTSKQLDKQVKELKDAHNKDFLSLKDDVRYTRDRVDALYNLQLEKNGQVQHDK